MGALDDHVVLLVVALTHRTHRQTVARPALAVVVLPLTPHARGSRPTRLTAHAPVTQTRLTTHAPTTQVYTSHNTRTCNTNTSHNTRTYKYNTSLHISQHTHL